MKIFLKLRILDLPVKHEKQVKYCLFYVLFIFFSIRVFFHGHLQLTGQHGKGEDHLIPLYNFHPLTNIQTFICNFAREMTITYF